MNEPYVKNPDIPRATRHLAFIHDALVNGNPHKYHSIFLLQSHEIVKETLIDQPESHPVFEAQVVVNDAILALRHQITPQPKEASHELRSALHDILRALVAYQDLESLMIGIRTGAVALNPHLPVFGSAPPPEDANLWSWDDNNVLVGDGRHRLEIQPRRSLNLDVEKPFTISDRENMIAQEIGRRQVLVSDGDRSATHVTYRLAPPLEGCGTNGHHEYVTASSVVAPITGPEVMVFPSDKDGNVTDFIDILCVRGTLDNTAPLREAGYIIQRQ